MDVLQVYKRIMNLWMIFVKWTDVKQLSFGSIGIDSLTEQMDKRTEFALLGFVLFNIQQFLTSFRRILLNQQYLLLHPGPDQRSDSSWVNQCC